MVIKIIAGISMVIAITTDFVNCTVLWTVVWAVVCALYGLYHFFQFCCRCPSKLRWHLLTATIWSVVVVAATLCLVVVPEQNPLSGLSLAVAGSALIPCWLQLLERWSGATSAQARRKLPARLLVQTLWGPLALWGMIYSIGQYGQQLFEDAVARRDLPTAFFLKDSGFGTADTAKMQVGLMNAVDTQNLEALSVYLALNTPTSGYAYSSEYQTAIIHAVKQENSMGTEMLLRYGDSVKEINYQTRDSLLHIAVMYGNVDQVKTLLRHGADRKATNDKNETPFMIAKQRHHKEITALLTQSGKQN